MHDDPPSPAPRRHAFVVGVNGAPAFNSIKAPLEAAEADARALRDALAAPACGFEVTLLVGEEATIDRVRHTLTRLLRTLGEQDELIFVFTGHAYTDLVQQRRETFLVTADFDHQDACDDPSLALTMRWLKMLCDHPAVGSVLILLDCCFAAHLLYEYGDGLQIDLRELIEKYKQGSHNAVRDQWTGRFRYVIGAAGFERAAHEREGHGLLAQALLRALCGEVSLGLRNGALVELQVEQLVAYLKQQIAPPPFADGSSESRCFVLARHPLQPDAPPPPFRDQDRADYLDRLIRVCDSLDLRTFGGPVDRLPLERVYVALKADRANVAERRAGQRQLWADAEAYLDYAELDGHKRQQLFRRLVALLDPLGLSIALRDRQVPSPQPTTRLDVAELLRDERWAVLLGDPGSGKTTLVRWVALQFARALQRGASRVVVPAVHVRADELAEDAATAQVDLGPLRLPILVRLADYEHARWNSATGHDTSLSLAEFLGRAPWLGQQLHRDATVGQALVQDALERQQALLLFDGLDEITDPARRGEVVDELERFITTHARDPRSRLAPTAPTFRDWQLSAEDHPWQAGGNQVLITSRVVGYQIAPLTANIVHYTVEDLSEAAIRRFCQAWAAAVGALPGGANASDLSATLLADDPHARGLRELAGNPLLLTILAGLFYTMQGKLPTQRISVYAAVVKVFFERRQEQLAARLHALGLHVEVVDYVLAHVARELHVNPHYPHALVDEAALRTWIKDGLRSHEGGKYTPKMTTQAKVLLKELRDLGGLLLERGDGIYGFIHRTFQEYFAALALAWDEERVAEEVVARLDDPAWHEVLLLAVAHTGVYHAPHLPTLLAAILAAPEPAAGLLPRNALFFARCVRELQQEPPANLVANATQQLIATYADRSWPPDETSQPPEPLREAIERALASLQPFAATRAALGAILATGSPPERFAVVERLLVNDATHPEFVPLLIHASRTWELPQAAVRELILRHFEQHPTAFMDNLLPERTLIATATPEALRPCVSSTSLRAGFASKNLSNITTATHEALRPCAFASKSPSDLEQIAASPTWRAILSATLYAPDPLQRTVIAPECVIFGNALLPDLWQAWQQQPAEAHLQAHLRTWAARHDDPARANAAALSLAFIDPAGFHAILAAQNDPERTHALLQTLLWLVFAYGDAGADGLATLLRSQPSALRALLETLIAELDAYQTTRQKEGHAPDAELAQLINDLHHIQNIDQLTEEKIKKIYLLLKK